MRFGCYLFAIFFLPLFCGGSSDKTRQTPSPPPILQECQVAVVITGAAVGDPFNDLTILGAEEATQLRNCKPLIVYNPSVDLFPEFLEYAVGNGSNIIISVGFERGETTFAAAEKYPNTTFAIVDVAYSTQLPNLIGIVFREDQAGFLMGFLLGSLDPNYSSVVGCLGGTPFPPVKKFCNGLRQGVLEACRSCSVFITYFPSFSNTTAGQLAAHDFFDLGTTALFGAGGAMGSAGILEFSMFNLPVGGVDADQYFTTFQGGNLDPAEGNASQIVSSALKRIDVAVRVTILEVLDGLRTSGTKVFDTAANGVGLAPCHDACFYISDETRAVLDLTFEQISQGIVTTGVDQTTGDLALYTQNITREWIKILPTGIVPPALYGHSFSSFNNNSVALLFAGRSSLSSTSLSNDLHLFDYNLVSWSKVIPNGDPPSPRAFHNAEVYNEDWLVVYGGSGASEVILSDIWLFNFPNKEWISVNTPSEPPPRSQFASAISGDFLYIYGGSSDSLVLGDMWRLDLASATTGSSVSWELVTVTVDDEDPENPISLERRDHRGFSNDTRLFFFCGELGSNQLTNEVIQFDTETGVMRRIAENQLESPPPIKNLAIMKYNNDVYLFGGVSAQSAFNNVYRFNLYNSEWVLLSAITSFAPPAMTSTAVTPLIDTASVNATRLVIYGGLSTSGPEQVIFFFGLPENPVQFEEFFSCSRKETFSVPAGTIDFEPTGQNDIYPISYRCDGFVDCGNLFDENSECSPSIERIYIAFTVILSFCFAFTIILIIFLVVRGKDKVILAASRNFLFVSVVGAILSYASLFMFFFKPTDAFCSAQIWLLALGFVTMFAPLLVKTYRIIKFFRTKQFFLKPLSDLELFVHLLLFYIPVILLLFVVQFVGEPEARLSKEPGESDCHESPKLHVLCKTDDLSIIAAILVVYYGVLLVLGVVAAVMTRHIQTPFNESEYIALSIYNFFFLGCVGVPMFYLLDEQPEVRLIILCLLVTLATTLFLCLLFCPKFFIIYHGGQEAYDEKTAERSTVVSTEGRATTGGKSVSQTSNFDD